MSNIWLAISVQWDDCSVAIGATGMPIRLYRARDRFAADSPGSGSVASRDVLVLVDAALRDAGLAGRQLAGLAYARGPGAFTALRVGAAIVQGLAHAWQRPVIALDSLTAMTATPPAGIGEASWIQVSALDARMGEVYTAVHRCTPTGFPVELRPPAVATIDAALLDINRLIALQPALPVVWSGLAFSRMPRLQEHVAAAAGIRVDGGIGEPDAASLLSVALRPGAPSPGPARNARPLYVRDKVALDRDEQRLAASHRAAQTGHGPSSDTPVAAERR